MGEEIISMTKFVLPIVLAVALVFTGLWGYNQYTQNRQYGILYG